MTRSDAAHLATLAAIALAWCAALFLPAVDVRGGPDASGFDLLVRGWRGADAGVFAWYANPLFMAAWLVAARGADRSAAVLAGLACGLALTSFAAGETARGAGMAVPAFDFAAGFYVWLLAQLALALVSAARAWRRRGRGSSSGANSYRNRD